MGPEEPRDHQCGLCELQSERFDVANPLRTPTGVRCDGAHPDRLGRFQRVAHPDRVDGALGKYMLGYLEKGIQNPMAQGRSTKIISMIK